MEEVYVPNTLFRNCLKLHCVGFHSNVPCLIPHHHVLDLSWLREIRRVCENLALLETLKKQFR